MATKIQALRYIKNTNGGATQANFMEDFEPIGPILWQGLDGLVYENERGQLYLTDAGTNKLEAVTNQEPDHD